MLGVTTLLYVVLLLIYNALISKMGFDYSTVEYWMMLFIMFSFSFATLIHFEPEKYLKGSNKNDTVCDSKQKDEEDNEGSNETPS